MPPSELIRQICLRIAIATRRATKQSRCVRASCPRLLRCARNDKQSRRPVKLAAWIGALLVMMPIMATAEDKVCIENTTIAKLQQALAEGRTTASALARDYLARIEAYDRAGPQLNAVREVNPDVLAIAAKLDGVKPNKDKPLAGVPILVKDNIAPADKQHTTAGSLALADARAKQDATVTARLRAAGAVILGKANLTEFANIMAMDMP